MKKRITQVEYQRLRSLLRDVQAHQAAETGIERSIRRLLGERSRDSQVSSDRIFDLVYNDEPLDETLELLGVEVEP